VTFLIDRTEYGQPFIAEDTKPQKTLERSCSCVFAPWLPNRCLRHGTGFHDEAQRSLLTNIPGIEQFLPVSLEAEEESGKIWVQGAGLGCCYSSRMLVDVAKTERCAAP